MNNITFRDAAEWASRKVHLSRGDLQSEFSDTRALLILKLYKNSRSGLPPFIKYAVSRKVLCAQAATAFLDSIIFRVWSSRAGSLRAVCTS